MTALVGIARFQRTIFIGYRDSFSVQNPVWLMPQARRICGRGLSLRMVLPTVKGVFQIQINYTELEKRVQQYIQTEDFQRDLADTANDYRRLGLPVPSAEVLRDQEIAALRRAMETVMICEAKGHLWKEKADPENGTSTLSCRRCGRRNI